MPGYGSRGYQGRGTASGGDTGRGSQPNRPSGGRGVQSGPRGQGGRQREIQQNIKRKQQQKAKAKADKIAADKRAADKRSAELASLVQRQQEEKQDYFDPTYVSKTTGKTVAQMQADAKTAGLKGMGQRADAMLASQELQKKLEKQGIQAMSDEEIDSMRNLFAAQGAGMDVTGYEAEVNKQKQSIIQKWQSGLYDKEQLKNTDEYKSLEKLSEGDPWNTIFGMSGTEAYQNYFINDKGEKVFTTAAGYDAGFDPSGMRTWTDIQDDPSAKFAYYGLLSDKTPTNMIREYLPQLGYKSYGPKGGSGMPGGWGGYGGYGGGYGGGGGGGYAYGPQPGYKPEQMAGFYTPQANLQQAMVNVHQTPTVFRKRGGIVSLLRMN